MTRVRADIIDAYIVRRALRTLEVLQLRRATEPLKGTWQPVMGHVRRSETALQCLWRELREETGLTRRSPEFLGAWALEQVHPYFVAGWDAVMLSPCFAVEVTLDWETKLNSEHDSARWVDVRRASRAFMWSGQRAAVAEVAAMVAGTDSSNLGALAARICSAVPVLKTRSRARGGPAEGGLR